MMTFLDRMYLKIKHFLDPESDRLYILLLLLLPIIAFWRNLDFSGLNLQFFHADFAGFYFPEFEYGTQLVGDIIHHKKSIGDLLWDPYNMMGMPLLGGIDRLSILYPVRLLFYIVGSFFPKSSLVFFATYYSLLHMSIGGIFTYLFARRCLKLPTFASFIAGLVYAIGGSSLHLALFINHMVGVAYLPAALYFLFTGWERQSYPRIVLAGLTLTPILMAGYFPMYFYSNMFLIFFMAGYFVRDRKTFSRMVWFFLIANIVAIGLSAIVLLPNIELSHVAERQAFNLNGSASNPVVPEDFLNYLIPSFFGIEKSGAIYGYIGTVSLMLVALVLSYGKKSRGMVLAIFSIVIFAVLSLGTGTFLHAVLYKLVPLYGSFRRTATLHYIIGFNLALLVGYGLYLLESKKLDVARVENYTKHFLLGFAALWLGLFLLRPIVASPGMVNDMIYFSFFPLLFAGISFLVFRNLYPNYSGIFRLAITILLIVDLCTVIARNGGTSSSYDPRLIISKPALVAKYAPTTTSTFQRMYLHEPTLRYSSAVDGIYQINGYYGLNMKEYGLLMSRYGKNGWIPPNSPLLDITGVKHIITTRQLAPEEKGKVSLASKSQIGSDDFGKYLTMNGTKIPAGTEVYDYENMDALPHAYLVGSVEAAKNDEDALARLDKLDVHKSAVITGASDLPAVSSENAGAPVTITTYESSQVKMSATSSGRSFLVLSDTYYPGWEAYVDGAKTPIYRTNLNFRGVFIDNGSHQIEFAYHPVSIYLGALISGLSAVAILAILRLGML